MSLDLDLLLRKRLDVRKVTEIRLKIVAHNVRRIGYPEIMDGIVPHWPCEAVYVNFVPKPRFTKVISSLNFKNIKCYNLGIFNSRGEQLCNETPLDIENSG